MAAALTPSPETPPIPENSPEIERARAAYARRKANVPLRRYDRIQAAQLLALQEREQAVADLLRRGGIESLRGLRILDVGCGLGAALRQLLDYDAEPAHLFGLDLLHERVEGARKLARICSFPAGTRGNCRSAMAVSILCCNSPFSPLSWTPL